MGVAALGNVATPAPVTIPPGRTALVFRAVADPTDVEVNVRYAIDDAMPTVRFAGLGRTTTLRQRVGTNGTTITLNAQFEVTSGPPPASIDVRAEITEVGGPDSFARAWSVAVQRAAAGAVVESFDTEADDIAADLADRVADRLLERLVDPLAKQLAAHLTTSKKPRSRRGSKRSPGTSKPRPGPRPGSSPRKSRRRK
jgi:hypothetical protein